MLAKADIIRLGLQGMGIDMPHITVEAYAGYKGEETPRAFTLEGA